MKHLKRFHFYEEIHPRDISYISEEFNKYFTVSFEFEIETFDKTDIKIDFQEFDEDVFEEVANLVIKDLEIKDRNEKKLIKDILGNLLDYTEYETMDLELFNSIFSTKEKNNREREIISYVKGIVLSFIAQDDFAYLKKQAKKFLPNFTSKWSRKIEFVGDPTLDRGIEIKPKKYVNSISEAIELINDFYNDLNSQNYWRFTEKTGLHINIGTQEKINYNPIKGLLILNDFSQKDKTPLVFKDMAWRMNNKFCSSLIPQLISLNDKEKQKIKNSINLHNLQEAENIFNDFLISKVEEWGHKNYGFNISKIQNNYIEFRYAGGEMPKEVLIEKVKYFCFLVYCMTNQEYKRKEYIKKLYKFVDNL